jgi:hypothetical protein
MHRGVAPKEMPGHQELCGEIVCFPFERVAVLCRRGHDIVATPGFVSGVMGGDVQVAQLVSDRESAPPSTLPRCKHDSRRRFFAGTDKTRGVGWLRAPGVAEVDLVSVEDGVEIAGANVVRNFAGASKQPGHATAPALIFRRAIDHGLFFWCFWRRNSA